MGRICSCFWCNATEILRRTIKYRSDHPFSGPTASNTPTVSVWAQPRPLPPCSCSRRVPSLARSALHLALDIVRLQSQHVLDISRPHQLLGKFERARDVSLGESHRLFGYVLG